MCSTSLVRSFEQIDLATDLVGGKGQSLILLARAGFPVPAGFCIASTAQRRLNGRPPREDSALAQHILDAYRQLGGGLVAVRSSASCEDRTATSFAGLLESILSVEGDDAVLEAVGCCWASLDSDRSRAYCRQLGVDEHDQAMAVVVQRMVLAEVAGVLFTQDPLDLEGRQMLVESARGLGDGVVSGSVTPDRFALDRATGEIRERHVSSPAGTPSLDEDRLRKLAEVGRRVEALFGSPRDIEWAWADGQFWLLQARPISAAPALEREQVRREEIERLRALAQPGGTVWARYNLAEVLPEPTPMSWAVVRDFLSGKGGLGQMYRDLGYTPDPSLDEIGIFDLICGRPYCNLDREPLFAFVGMPLEHSFAALKANPERALYPRVSANCAKMGWRFWLGLPRLLWKTWRNELRVRSLSRTVAAKLHKEIFRDFHAAYQREASIDWTKLAEAELVRQFDSWRKRTLHTFARDSLKPTALAGVALANVERFLRSVLPAPRATALLAKCLTAVNSKLGASVRALKAGRMRRESFLQQFGHRGAQEMELARPRWAEDPDALDRLVAHPEEKETLKPDVNAEWDTVAKEANLGASARQFWAGEVKRLLTYVELREEAKSYLLLGYGVLRRILLELDRRYHLCGGIFYLIPEELPELSAGTNLAGRITERRKRRRLALSLSAPQVIFSDDLEVIGRPEPLAVAQSLQGVPLSPGVAEGPALVLSEPGPPPQEPYVLVCPSTDPAWVPLFVGAKALVMEVGGVLSHGAIVAREFALPAVAGFPELRRQIQTGQRLRVDGETGKVTILP
jgi:pyruvate,water dikinase